MNPGGHESTGYHGERHVTPERLLALLTRIVGMRFSFVVHSQHDHADQVTLCGCLIAVEIAQELCLTLPPPCPLGSGRCGHGLCQGGEAAPEGIGGLARFGFAEVGVGFVALGGLVALLEGSDGEQPPSAVLGDESAFGAVAHTLQARMALGGNTSRVTISPYPSEDCSAMGGYSTDQSPVMKAGAARRRSR